MTELVYLNDQLIDADQATISIHDAGLLHGVGLFETMRSYNSRVFRLKDHFDRLFYSAEKLGLAITQLRDQITTAIGELLSANQLDNARLRLTVTRGSLRGALDDQPPQSTLLITASPLQPYPAEYYQKGILAVICPYKQNPDDPMAGHKTINYFPRLLALQNAQRARAGEALWFTTTNRLAEGCISNIFLVKNNTLFTPPTDTPVLPGITRQAVIELAEKNDIPCRQNELVIKDLLDADEVFLTNSIMELMPICHIERHVVGAETPGPLYKQIHDLYREAVCSM